MDLHFSQNIAEQHHQPHHLENREFGSESYNNSFQNLPGAAAEWILFDPSSDEDVLSSSFSQGQNLTEVKSSILSNLALARVTNDALLEDESLVNILRNDSHLRLQLPNHNGQGLFRDNEVSLKQKINDWQQDQMVSILQEKQKDSLTHAASTNEVAESWGIDDHSHLYSSTTGKQLPVNKSKSFYGDYLLRGLSDKELGKVKKSSVELSKYLRNDGTYTLDNKSSFASNPVIRQFLLSTYLINQKLYKKSEKSWDNGSNELFWETDRQSLYSSRLSVSSSNGNWLSDSWAEVN